MGFLVFLIVMFLFVLGMVGFCRMVAWLFTDRKTVQYDRLQQQLDDEEFEREEDRRRSISEENRQITISSERKKPKTNQQHKHPSSCTPASFITETEANLYKAIFSLVERNGKKKDISSTDQLPVILSGQELIKYKHVAKKQSPEEIIESIEKELNYIKTKGTIDPDVVDATMYIFMLIYMNYSERFEEWNIAMMDTVLKKAGI
ncbi:MAG: hypothetical protein AB7S75_24050 [Desulfococcaceae bacterium]